MYIRQRGLSELANAGLRIHNFAETTSPEYRMDGSYAGGLQYNHAVCIIIHVMCEGLLCARHSLVRPAQQLIPITTARRIDYWKL